MWIVDASHRAQFRSKTEEENERRATDSICYHFILFGDYFILCASFVVKQVFRSGKQRSIRNVDDATTVRWDSRLDRRTASSLKLFNVNCRMFHWLSEWHEAHDMCLGLFCVHFRLSCHYIWFRPITVGNNFHWSTFDATTDKDASSLCWRWSFTLSGFVLIRCDGCVCVCMCVSDSLNEKKNNDDRTTLNLHRHSTRVSRIMCFCLWKEKERQNICFDCFR